VTVLTNATVVTPHGVIDRGWVQLDGTRINAVGGDRPPAGPTADLGGHTLVPGFVDLHVHGGGGHDITAGEPAESAAAVAFHQHHGTTSTLLSLVTAPVDHLVAAARALSALVEPDGQIVGLHYEGPFLAACRCGAQDPHHLIAPDLAVLRQLLDAAQGTTRMVTLAPELPGGLDLVGAVVAAGTIAAIGHSDATYQQAAAAIAAGARVATHLFNGMRPFTHREPGIAGAALASADVLCELIVDGAHLHPATVAMAAAAKGDGGIALITDAISAAGAPDGTYRLGRLDVEVAGGVARLAGAGPAEQRSLAGSTLTMDRALRNSVAAGVSLVRASRAASWAPARALGIHHRTGSIEAGKDADLVVLDANLAVHAVIARGAVVRSGADVDLAALAPKDA
jgi:N-acetylglucosamine-6-phosphate deacetylase